MHRILCVCLLLLAGVSFSQTSDKYNSPYAGFYRAEELFTKEQYSAAREEFRLFMNRFENKLDAKYIQARYYEGISALRLYQNDAVPLLELFNKDYPESIYRKDIYFQLGKFYYQKKEYDVAVEWLTKLDVTDVEPEEADEYRFKLGLSYFELNNYDKARFQFYEVKDSPSQYGAPSLYYFSHIEYTKGSYQNALDGFLRLKDDPSFSRLVPSYIVQIYYLQGKYKEVTEFAPQIMDSIEVTSAKTIEHMIGDSYYKMGQYQEAEPYLEKYNRSSLTTRTEDYQLGFTYYKNKKYQKAIPYLDKATKVEDSLAQIAFYQIGECYLLLDQPVPARSAFERASNMEADRKISEDANYQYAVLSYKLDLNPYDEALVAFENYLNKYPNSKRKSDVYQYLVNVYTSTNSYDKALQSLDNLPNKDVRLKSAYQIIAFNAGVEQFQNENYSKAIEYFKLVDRFNIESNLSGKAEFWMGDAEYQMKHYGKAVSGYRSFLNSTAVSDQKMKGDAYYNMGYAKLNLHDTLAAIENFTLYTQQGQHDSKKKLADAYMRIADGYYSTRQNEPAINAYREVVRMKAGYEDQALHYLGKTLGYSGKNDEKIWCHKEILEKYPRSKYTQVAILEIAVTYLTMNKYNESMKYYKQLIDEYPNTYLVRDAMIAVADLHYKMQNYLKAEQAYKDVLNKFSGDKGVCDLCSKNLVALYATMREQERLQMMIQEFPCLEVSKDDQEKLFYDPAFQFYNDSDFVKAIPEIKKYLKNYPNGNYTSEMMAFLGNAYFSLDSIELALDTYKKFLQRPNNGYTEYVASRSAKYTYNNERYEEAILFYKKVEEVSSQPDVLNNAQIGIMRSAFLLKKYQDAIVYADKVLGQSQLTNTIRFEAQYAKGMSCYHVGKMTESRNALEYVVLNTTTVLGAEAKYTMAAIAYQADSLDETDKLVRELLKMKPSYNYWVAKGLILQTRVLIKKDDLFQAEQTLKSVLEHYPNKEDGILIEANELWAELMQIKDKPKNVEPENKTIIEVDGKQ
ncbi:MAG: tetratricopeptide repeat protein [Crocinitomicaceae bacterium]|jgi:tetratricopeptide (TPR) repeat protein|nr:tetratricopeptide repeat protein [Crocinitomicaceae bacterium]